VDFDITNQLLIRSFAIVRYWKKQFQYNDTVHQLFIDFKEAYDSVRQEEFHNTLTKSVIPKKLLNRLECV
jgi:hypothetical protein